MKRKYDNESKDLSNFCARFVQSFPSVGGSLSGGRADLTQTSRTSHIRCYMTVCHISLGSFSIGSNLS